LGGQGGNDLLEGGSGADALYGDDGDDLLRGGSGNDFVAGGAGFDIAFFSGPRSSYVITVGNGFTTVTGVDGTDTLVGVERLQFDDVAVAGSAPAADGWVL
jgi:Ca2+-binding RTX toxin-like protein